MEERTRQALARRFDEHTAQAARLDYLGGHASLRLYWRVNLPPRPEKPWPREENTLMAMVFPEGVDPLASDEKEQSKKPLEVDGKPELPFVTIHRLLEHLSLPVPDIELVDLELGVLLLEDLGNEHFEDLYLEIVKDFGDSPRELRLPTEQLYHRAINLLVDLQSSYVRAQLDRNDNPPDALVQQRQFDRELLRWELDHYIEWGLKAQYGEDVLEDAAEDLDRLFDELVDELVALPSTMVLRDFQSRNMLHKNGKLHLIDFQDALTGPMIYDLVALLRDSYIELPYLVVHRLVDHYTKQGFAAGLDWCDDAELVQRAFNLQTVQRKLKDAGRFIFIDRVKGNPDFLPYYKSSITYVRQALEMLPAYEELADILSEFEPAWHDD